MPLIRVFDLSITFFYLHNYSDSGATGGGGGGAGGRDLDDLKYGGLKTHFSQ